MHKKGFRCGQDHNWPSDLRHQLWIKVKDAEEITGRLQTDLQQLKQKVGPPHAF